MMVSFLLRLRQMFGQPVSRRRFMKVGQYAGLFSLCLLIAVGCRNGGNSTSTVGTSDRVSIGTTRSARTLDPADAYEIFPGILLYNMGDRLYTYAPGTTDLTPQLATDLPTISDDGLTYTIPLRDDVTLHDGTPFTAEVMAFSIQRILENGGKPASLISGKIDSAAASESGELVITLKAPFAAFPSLLTFSGITPVSPEAYEVGAGSFNPNNFVGTGPYKLASFSSDVIKLDVNEDYWGVKPANKGIDIQIFTSAVNLYNTFTSGGLDVAYQTLDPDQISQLESDAEGNDWQVIEAGTTVINYLSLNQKIAPFDDLNARKAVAAMMDRQLISDRAFKGQAEPLYSLIPKSFSVYKPVFEEAYGDGDFELAKQFLTEAGINEANPLEFEIWYPTASTPRQIAASTIKQSIEQALPGLVNVTVNSADSNTLWENVESGAYSSVLSNWYADYFDPENFVQPFITCDEGSEADLCAAGATQANGSFYYSNKANALVKQQNAEQNVEKRDALFDEIQDLTVTDVPYVPLWQTKDYVFATTNVNDVAIEPNQQFLLWQIEKGE